MQLSAPAFDHRKRINILQYFNSLNHCCELSEAGADFTLFSNRLLINVSSSKKTMSLNIMFIPLKLTPDKREIQYPSLLVNSMYHTEIVRIIARISVDFSDYYCAILFCQRDFHVINYPVPEKAVICRAYPEFKIQKNDGLL